MPGRARSALRAPAVLLPLLAAATVALLSTAGTVADDDDLVRAASASHVNEVRAPEMSAPEAIRRSMLEEFAQERAIDARMAEERQARQSVVAAKRDRIAAAPPPVVPAVVTPGDTVWDRLARCESGGNWAASHGLYEGGLQFHPSTWDANKPSGYPDHAYQATREQQIAVGERVRARQGWGAWPACASELGLR